MEYITVTGATATAMMRQLEHDHKHKVNTWVDCCVRGCPEAGTDKLGTGEDLTWLCAWHGIAWGKFLDNWRIATGKRVRLGKFGNWHIRFREFMEWAEKNPLDRTFLPGEAAKPGEPHQRWFVPPKCTIKLHTVKGDSLASEGIRDGHILGYDTAAKPKAGELAVLRSGRGKETARRVTDSDLEGPLILGRVSQHYGDPIPMEGTSGKSYPLVRDFTRVEPAPVG